MTNTHANKMSVSIKARLQFHACMMLSICHFTLKRSCVISHEDMMCRD